MGYDISFHPVVLHQEGALIRDLLLETKTPREIVSALPNCNDDLPAIVEQNLADLRDNWETNEYLASRASYNAAMLSGYFRPYWYARGQAISFCIDHDVQRTFTPLLEWLGPPFDARPDPSHGQIIENFTGSGVITNPREFLGWLESQDFDDKLLDLETYESVRRCAEYAIRHSCHMIEVADVYTVAGHCTNPDNACEHFRKE